MSEVPTSAPPLPAIAAAPPPPLGRPAGVATRAPLGLWLAATLVVVATLLPLVYLAVRASSLDRPVLTVLAQAGTAALLQRSALLVVAVTAATVAIGVPVAYLTTRTDLPLRRWFTVLTAVPLVIPTFVGAYTFIAALGPGGIVPTWLEPLGIRVPRIYGFWGAFVTLTGFTFPYVSLTVQSALRGLDPALEQASRSLGRGPRATFVRITLPQLRPAIGAGALLVALYVLSDFGAVSLLRYSTFTRAIYLQYQAAFDRTPAALLGLVLVGCTAIVLLTETRLLARSPGSYSGARAVTPRRADVVALGAWRVPAVLLCSLVVLGTLAAPLLTITYWLSRAARAGVEFVPTISAAWRSITASAAGAAAATVAAAPVAILATRYRHRAGRVLERFAYAGHALPGIVVALALVFFGARFGGPLYQTLALLVFAYVVLFLPQALGAIRASLLQVPPHIEEAARGLGSTPLGVLRRVVLPIARRGALSGAALVFLTCMKELPATLLLAPSGFHTLATEIWAATTDASFSRAALPAVVLIALGGLPLALIVVRERELTHD